ncbi:MAG: long-chain fatty acid--CoA ligase [Planctomycetales bacterium]|nr:long-chain fatty acid--CoA ligase [Planctomycetales bacterium]
MQGLMMDYPLTTNVILRRAETMYPHREIITRRGDGRLDRSSYGEMARRAKQLALALAALGIGRGDRVATLSWNHAEHQEAYFGIPAAGAVLHTLNLRLPHEEIAYIADHADDRVLIVDECLLDIYDSIRTRVPFEHVVVVRESDAALPEGMIDYEELLAQYDAGDYVDPQLDEREAAAMCYTSGTTGRSKGVVYSHRSTVLHSLALTMADALGVCAADVIVPVVPMFHVNAWGIPYTAAMVGAVQVFPGPRPTPADILELMTSQRATLAAGVPTVWLGMLELLDQAPGKHDLSSVRAIAVGGAASPQRMVESYDRHGVRIVCAWGMTETSPIGTVSILPKELQDADPDVQMQQRLRQGFPVPLVELRARNENGLVPWDGQTMGELEICGPWVASQYYESSDPTAGMAFTDDGWFRTGDIVVIRPDGSMHLQDRAKDVIKSGGEWISSIALEGALMGHDRVAEAAVIAMPDERWGERPLAVVVPRGDTPPTSDELLAMLAEQFPKWWLPEQIVVRKEIPKTSAGKFLKSALREQYTARV